MKTENLPAHGLMDKTMGVLSKMLDFRAKNHGVIASNLSNIDTPGFRPKELEFNEELRRAVDRTGIQMKRTNDKHFSGPGGALGKDGASFSVHPLESPDGNGNELDLDREMAKMSQNNLLYEATVKLLSKKFDELKTAIEGRG